MDECVTDRPIYAGNGSLWLAWKYALPERQTPPDVLNADPDQVRRSLLKMTDMEAGTLLRWAVAMRGRGDAPAKPCCLQITA
jgi:hypothetical protein